MLRAEVWLYLSLVLMAFAVYVLVYTFVARRKDAQILSWASGQEPVKSRSPLINLARPLVHQFMLKYVTYLKTPEKEAQIQKLLVTAGLRDELNVDEFIGFQIFYGIAFPIFLLLLNFGYGLGLPWPLLVLMGLIGWKFPELYAKSEKQKRNLAIQTELPFFADLLALSTEAGLDFVGAIQKIVDKSSHTALGQEFSIVLKDIKLGATRTAALKGLAERVELPEVVSFVAVLVDADQTGASIAKVLKDQSQQLRVERFARAEKAGAKASQMILFPILLFIVPAVFVVIFGPIAISFLSGGAR